MEAENDDMEIDFNGHRRIVSRKEWEAKRLIPGAAIQCREPGKREEALLDCLLEIKDAHIETIPMDWPATIPMIEDLGEKAYDEAIDCHGQLTAEQIANAQKRAAPRLELIKKMGPHKTKEEWRTFWESYHRPFYPDLMLGTEETRDTHIKPAVWFDDICDNGGAITDCGGTITMPPPLKWYQKLLRYRLRNPFYMADE